MAGKGIVGREGSDGVAGMRVSCGGATNGRQISKEGGRRGGSSASAEPKGRVTLGDARDAGKGGLIGACLCRGRGRNH